MPSNISEIDQFKELTWEDIENWAGSKVLSRGRKYQQGRLVTLAGLRQTHARKPRLLQTLARLEGRKIVDEK